ncbi:beta-glucosidase BglX [Pseudomonas sp. NPDC007930]|uniref:beta-glucosidase BglX n=1 Tax=Pseudomonas sp. NPDC007930 TaxID=3364417 RepID=UPI0036E3D50D
MNKLYMLGLAAGLAWNTSFAAAYTPPTQDKNTFISELMQRMTLEEKIGQLRLISIGPDMNLEKIQQELAAGHIGATFNSVVPWDNRVMQEAALRSRLHIPMFFAYDVIHGHRTMFPISLGLAASWDLPAVTRVGQVAAAEASADSLDMTYGPMVDIARDPRWGRTSEGFGEDTYLVSKMGAAMVHGFQGKNASEPGSIMAIVKHFALYGAVEGGRDYNVVDMSPQRMYNDYLPPYRAALDAGAGGVMVALNSINGVPATSNTWLMQQLLRKDWGFKGLTVSDHGAILELIKHGVAVDAADAARQAIKAGIDQSMNDMAYGVSLPKLIEQGKVPQSEVDAAVREVLSTKWDLGLFADPYRRIGKKENDPADINAETRLHREDARDVARRTLVLLKNANHVLPLRKQGTIAVIGPLADSHTDMLGSWSAAGLPKQTVTVLDGIREAVGNSAKVLYARGANVTDDRNSIVFLNNIILDHTEVQPDPRTAQEMIDEALKVAASSDVIVAAVGESRGMSHESASRTSLAIPDTQRQLITALRATGKPLVLVLMNGRPLSLERENEQADALLETWFSGTEGGHAIADVLFGAYNPSGKLPITFPRSVGQIPMYYNHPTIGRPVQPGEPGNYRSQYFDADTSPLYPFGFGLSYTQFDVSDVKLSAATLKPGGSVEASVTVRNTGKLAGETTVQLYLHDRAASMARPIKELKGFEKVLLQPGEQQVVRFNIDVNMLKFYDQQLKHVAEPGQFDVQIGLDSNDVKQASFELL